MNKLKELTKAIQRACPEVLELSFGCEFEDVSSGKHLYATNISPTDVVEGVNNNMTQGSYGVHIDRVKIIGHPIELSHVLKAMKAQSNSEYAKFPTVALKDYRLGYTELLSFWQLTLPFSSQSQDVIDFLYDLIVKE